MVYHAANNLSASSYLSASGRCKLYKSCKWLILQVVAAYGLLQLVKVQAAIFKLQVPFTSEPLAALGGLYKLASCKLICCKCPYIRQDTKNKKLWVRIQQAWEWNFKNLDFLSAHISKLKKNRFWVFLERISNCFSYQTLSGVDLGYEFEFNVVLFTSKMIRLKRISSNSWPNCTLWAGIENPYSKAFIAFSSLQALILFFFEKYQKV